MNAVVRTEPQEGQSLITVIARAASDPAVNIEKMERLLQMQERILDRNAKAAFADALARLQPKLPILAERGGIKDRNGNVQSRYALWEDIVGVVTPLLAEEGFSLSFRTSSDKDGVKVTGVLLHREGHSESTELWLPMDVSGSKNNVQGVGSSTSYGKRYTASALLNLRTGDVDDDGRAAGRKSAETLSEAQVANLDCLLADVGADKAKFLRYAKVDSLSEILAVNYSACVAAIEAKRAK